MAMQGALRQGTVLDLCGLAVLLCLSRWLGVCGCALRCGYLASSALTVLIFKRRCKEFRAIPLVMLSDSIGLGPYSTTALVGCLGTPASVRLLKARAEGLSTMCNKRYHRLLIGRPEIFALEYQRL